ncbi:MAG: T9SS type A sorting domain-containing protein [Bacteroidales bacterium]|nr:T9SS type A sorting domain-containing protein [Bacteroidales bacterium]
MKRLLLFSLALGIVVVGFSQQRATVPREMRQQAIKNQRNTDQVTNYRPFENPTYKYGALIPAETEVGTTFYDRQTNSTNQNRLYLFDDGSLGATWILGVENPGFNDRGSGYNYFDGDEWGNYPQGRIESDRCGWPSYTPWGENGEIIFAHIAGGNDIGLLVNKRSEKGQEEWTETFYQGPTGAEGLVWPRAIADGVDNSIIHLLAVTRPEANGGTMYAGLDGALLYSRTTDGGESWEVENLLMDELSSQYFSHFNGDTYDWATPKNNTLAFVVGDSFTEMFLMKSTDGGNTWNKTLIWDHPYPGWNYEVTDTFFCTDGSLDVELDANGMAHVVFGVNYTYSDGVDTYWYAYVDGVGYWNETMPAFSNNFNALSPYGDPGTELIEDYNLIGWTQDVDGDSLITYIGETLDDVGKYYVGCSSMVQLVMGDQNQLYVFFSSITETYDNEIQNYRHLWSRVSTDGGLSWGPFTDLSGSLIHIFDEFVFPSCADNTAGNSIFLVCQVDNEPGMAVAGDLDPFGENRMVVMEVFKDEITGVGETQVNHANFEVFQNYPNPSNGLTSIRVDVDQDYLVGLKIHNLMGQLVYEIQPEIVYSRNHIWEINTSDFKPGIYFYSVSAGNNQITKKMIVD